MSTHNPATFAARKADGRFGLLSRSAFDAYARTLEDGVYDVIVKKHRDTRSGAQNRRYWALLTCAAESLGWDDPVEHLHDEIAHQLLSLPPVNGLRRRMRTPKLNTQEFTVYMDRVEAFLVTELHADLSAWGEHEDQHGREA